MVVSRLGVAPPVTVRGEVPRVVVTGGFGGDAMADSLFLRFFGLCGKRIIA